MKNKESNQKSNISKKGNSNNNNSINSNNNFRNDNKEYNFNDNINRTKSKGPTKSQINRLKRFYNTTRWIPNSSFTTFFGKPAFENYGYGNTNPVYGGLFYGNYMLSHNINPVDGSNLPEEKQVYASCMEKANKNRKSRKPEPPRKVPDEIRNTPEELDQIKLRNPIFQHINNFANREIQKPNLITAKYFKSPKGTPKKEQDPNKCFQINEEFDIEGLLEGKTGYKKKKTVINSKADGVFYAKELKKKIVKQKIDNTNPNYLKSLKENKDEKIKNDNISIKNEAKKELKDESANDLNKKNLISENNNLENPNDDLCNNDFSNNVNPNTLKNKMKEFYEKMLEEKINSSDDINKEEKEPNYMNSSMINALSTHVPEDKTYVSQYNRDYNILKTEIHRQKIAKKENPCLLPTNEIK